MTMLAGARIAFAMLVVTFVIVMTTTAQQASQNYAKKTAAQRTKKTAIHKNSFGWDKLYIRVNVTYLTDGTSHQKTSPKIIR